MYSSNCCFLTCIQISQEAGKVVWYAHLFQNFPQFVVIHTVKGFGVVNKAEVDVFLELSCFFYDPADVGNLISSSSAFLKSSLNIWKFAVHILLNPGLENLENFEHYFASMWSEEHFIVMCTCWCFSERLFLYFTCICFVSLSKLKNCKYSIFSFVLWHDGLTSELIDLKRF